MAYDRQKLYEEAKHLIVSMELVRDYQVYNELGIAESTFYDKFKSDSKEMETIKRLLSQNRSSIKRRLMKSFEDGNSAEKIALFKLLANKEELDILQNQQVEHKGKIETFNPIEIIHGIKGKS